MGKVKELWVERNERLYEEATQIVLFDPKYIDEDFNESVQLEFERLRKENAK